MLLPPRHIGSNNTNAPTDLTPASTYGIIVPTGSATHVLNATPTVLVTSTLHDTFWVTISFRNTLAANTRTDTLVNIYVGASGSEKVIIPNLVAGWSGLGAGNSGCGPKVYGFPLFIPSGSRISALAQSIRTGQNVYTWIKLSGGGDPPHWVGRSVEALGANTTSSNGVSVTPGSAAEGAFTTVGTTTVQYGYIIPMLHGNVPDATITAESLGLDIGSGDSLYRGLENFFFAQTTDDDVAPYSGENGVFVNIPANTQLQVRLQSASTAVEAKDCCLYGVY